MNVRNLRIDALRGVAVLMVLELHLVSNVMPWADLASTVLGGVAYSLLHYGWVGVEIFFVMSAYLLTSILLRHREEDDLFRSFYLRRAFRILPLYWLLLLVGSLSRAWWTFIDGDPQAWLWRDQYPLIYYILFLQNWITGWNGAHVAHFYSVTWSLAVEEHFYLLLPLLVTRLTARRLCGVAVFFVIAGPFIRAGLTIAPGPFAAYAWTIAQLDAFSWGVLLAYAQHFRPELLKQISSKFNMGMLAVNLLIVAIIAAPDIDEHKDAALSVTLGALVGVCALAAAISPTSVPARHPSALTMFLAWCGRRCFSLYLLHKPVIGAVALAAPFKDTATDGAASLILIAIPATFLVCAFTYRFIEEPFMALADRVAPYSQRPAKSINAA